MYILTIKKHSNINLMKFRVFLFIYIFLTVQSVLAFFCGLCKWNMLFFFVFYMPFFLLLEFCNGD